MYVVTQYRLYVQPQQNYQDCDNEEKDQDGKQIAQEHGKARFRYILCLSLLRTAQTPLIVYKGVTGRQRCKTKMVITCWTYLLIKIGLVLEDYGTHK